MWKSVGSGIKHLFSSCVSRPRPPPIPSDVDVREEYANAFRTESYNEFWTRVLAVAQRDPKRQRSMGSTTATRLPSYRLFAENLLDPDQPTVTRLLTLTRIRTRPEIWSLLYNYFQETTNASILCGILLKDVDRMRIKYRSLKRTLESFKKAQFSSKIHMPAVLARLTDFTKCINPFLASSSSSSRFRTVQAKCSELLKQLESSRDRIRSKLQLLKGLKHGSAIFLVALTASITMVILSHGLAIVMAIPGLLVVSVDRTSTKRLAKASAQLDAAAKGTYILNRDLDTVSRLVARLDDELQHMQAIVGFWLDRTKDLLCTGNEVARELNKNDTSFIAQLDELEEHLYLCFMTINRARNLVVKEILDLRPT